jgi:hypothetical protein
MKSLRTLLLLFLSLTGLDSQAQVANDVGVQNAIIAALPAGLQPESASADDIAQAATTLAFTMDGDLESNLTQVTVSLGELTRARRFPRAPRFGEGNPVGRLYLKVLNLASSNPDVSSSTYYALTVQDMTRLAAAVREGQNFLNGAKSAAITRK